MSNRHPIVRLVAAVSVLTGFPVFASASSPARAPAAQFGKHDVLSKAKDNDAKASLLERLFSESTGNLIFAESLDVYGISPESFGKAIGQPRLGKDFASACLEYRDAFKAIVNGGVDTHTDQALNDVSVKLDALTQMHEDLDTAGADDFRFPDKKVRASADPTFADIIETVSHFTEGEEAAPGLKGALNVLADLAQTDDEKQQIQVLQNSLQDILRITQIQEGELHRDLIVGVTHSSVGAFLSRTNAALKKDEDAITAASQRLTEIVRYPAVPLLPQNQT